MQRTNQECCLFIKGCVYCWLVHIPPDAGTRSLRLSPLPLQHSCSPNLFVQNVFVDTHDLRFPWVAFFASK